MKKYLFLLFLLISQTGICQNNNSEKTITVSNNLKPTNVTDYFIFYIDTVKTFTPENFQNIKYWKPLDNRIFKQKQDYEIENYNLWLQTTLKNTSLDTISLVMSMNNFRKIKIILQSSHALSYKEIGYLTNSNLRDFEEDPSSFKIQLLPLQETKITINTYVDYLSEKGLEIKLQSRDNYSTAELNYINKHNSLFAVFTLLTGGILIMLFYNIILFLQYKENNYLYYALHLLFTFLNYGIIADGLHQDFFGSLNQYRDLMIESTYVLSFIFYSIFVYSVLSEKTKREIKKLFVFYISFMILYLLSVHLVFQSENLIIISNFTVAALLFRLVSCFYGIYIIYQLLKTHKNSYLKYIMYGTLVLIISYFIHVIFNLIYGNSILNHYFNLIGTLIEILFFTYALNLRKKLAEQERDILINMNSLKSRFFANISHEFRTPLTLIKSPVQSLKSKIVDENQIQELNLINANANRMLELVDQLLELSKIDSGNLKLILKDANVGSFLHSIIEPFEFQSKELALKFEMNIQKSVENFLFDKDVIQKIVTNLLSNAFKYATANQTVQFSSSIENLNLKFVIANSGTEVKKEDLNKLFERFYQKKENSQGVGIGLSLVKELIDLYKGTIETKIENGYLIFTVTIPLQNVPNAIVIANVTSPEIILNEKNSDSDLPILLIVDDNQDIRNVIKSIFIKEFTIVEAQDGEQAFKIAKKEIPDCIISDIVMPKMDGFELTKTIKNNELTSFIPIILLTAKSSDEYKLEGLQSTADAFLTKPFNNDILKATVNQQIAERKKLQKRYSQELVLRPVDIVINSVDEKFLEKLQLILDKELSNSEFSADNFATAISMSRMQLHRKLKSLLGVSATEFLRNERLKTAVELLKQGNGNISEIAYSVGFNDVSYFTKCFKEVYKVTPTEFLNKK